MSVMTRQTRRLSTGAFLLSVVGACALMALPQEMLPQENIDSGPVVFALSVQEQDGRVIASPVVVGDAGQKVEVRMMCESDPRFERMSLVLDPLESSVDGELAFSYELRVAGRVESARGTVRLPTGAEQRIEVSDGNGVTLALFAAPVTHPGIESYLKDRRERLSRPHI